VRESPETRVWVQPNIFRRSAGNRQPVQPAVRAKGTSPPDKQRANCRGCVRIVRTDKHLSLCNIEAVMDAADHADLGIETLSRREPAHAPT
jgi:hypothetical protein